MPILKFRRARSADFILHIFCFLNLINGLVLDGLNFKNASKTRRKFHYDALGRVKFIASLLKNCRFTEDAALCDIYLKRFFDF